MFEDFTLNNAITTGCTSLVGGPTPGVCPYKVISGRKTINIFLSSMGDVCDQKEDDDEYNSLCYHVFSPDAAGALFNS